MFVPIKTRKTATAAVTSPTKRSAIPSLTVAQTVERAAPSGAELTAPAPAESLGTAETLHLLDQLTGWRFSFLLEKSQLPQLNQTVETRRTGAKVGFERLPLLNTAFPIEEISQGSDRGAIRSFHAAELLKKSPI